MRRDAMPALGSATHTSVILNERMPWGGPRFHPRGEHPATWRLRRLRDMALEHRGRVLAAVQRGEWFAEDPFANLDAMVAHIENEVAAFEAGEDEAKRMAWLSFHDRRRDA